jgi:surface-anchored protein
MMASGVNAMKKTLLITGAALLAGLANAQTYYTEGHADIGIGHDGTNWDLHFHDDTGMTEYAPEDVVIVAPLSSQWATPASNFGFTGVAGGGSIFRLRQTAFAGQPFLGIGTEEFLAPSASYTDSDARLNRVFGTNAGEWVSLELVNVTGPGVFSLWSNDPDGSGTPLVWMSSNDGISSSDRYVAQPGAHDHANWGFSKAGTYEVTVRGKFWDGSAFQTSDNATYTFQAVPEPASMAALGLGLVGLLRRRNKKSV